MDVAILFLSALTLALAAALVMTILKVRQHRRHLDARIDQLAAEARDRSTDLSKWLERLDTRLHQVERWHRTQRLHGLVDQAAGSGLMRPDAAGKLHDQLTALADEIQADEVS